MKKKNDIKITLIFWLLNIFCIYVVWIVRWIIYFFMVESFSTNTYVKNTLWKINNWVHGRRQVEYLLNIKHSFSSGFSLCCSILAKIDIPFQLYEYPWCSFLTWWLIIRSSLDVYFSLFSLQQICVKLMSLILL